MTKRILLSLEKTEVYEENKKLVLRIEVDPWMATYRSFDAKEVQKLVDTFNDWLICIQPDPR